jgi:hypothetical protein
MISQIQRFGDIQLVSALLVRQPQRVRFSVVAFCYDPMLPPKVQRLVKQERPG